MRIQPYRDKKFAQIERDAAPSLRATGQHLVALRFYDRRSGPKTEIRMVKNHVAKPAYVEPAAPVVDGVRMRWEKGRLVPRVSRSA